MPNVSELQKQAERLKTFIDDMQSSSNQLQQKCEQMQNTHNSKIENLDLSFETIDKKFQELIGVANNLEESLNSLVKNIKQEPPTE